MTLTRATRLLALTLLLACHGSGGDRATDDAAHTDVDVTPASAEGVQCPNILRPNKTLTCEGDAAVCCLTGQLLTPSCKPTVAACGQKNSHLVCDDATDCDDGKICCLAELNTGTQTFWGSCKAKCSLIEKPMCSGEGTCAQGWDCCIDEGDVWGTCVKSGQACPVDTSVSR